MCIMKGHVLFLFCDIIQLKTNQSPFVYVTDHYGKRGLLCFHDFYFFINATDDLPRCRVQASVPNPE